MPHALTCTYKEKMSLLVIHKLYDMFKTLTSMEVAQSYSAQCPNDGREVASRSLQLIQAALQHTGPPVKKERAYRGKVADHWEAK